MSFDRKVEEDRHSDGEQLPLFISRALTTHQRVNVLPTNGINPSLGMLFKEGAADSALILGDSKKVLRQMPEGAFQSCVTSPPYWSLRNYNIPGQIGLELSLNRSI